MKKDIVLSTGAVVKHKPMDNGATEAYIEDRCMTDAEWREYVEITFRKKDHDANTI